jgi:hypothetical protein
MLSEFNAYLEGRIGKSPYVWGAQGQQFDSYEALFAFIERHESGNDEKRALAYAKKLQAAGVPIEDIRVFDCSGLGMFWLQNTKQIFSYDMSADSMYKQCKPITRAELHVGDQAFRGSAKKKTHIGYVTKIVNGVPYITEAKGRDDGVVERQIDASGSSHWKYFGRPKYFEADILASDTRFRLTRTLKYDMSGADVLALEKRLGELGFDCKISAKEIRTGIGHWGNGCEAAFRAWQQLHPDCGKLVKGKWVPDGRCGPKSATALGFVWAGK